MNIINKTWTCDSCACNKICDHFRFGFENCNNYIPRNINLHLSLDKIPYDFLTVEVQEEK